MNTVYGSATSDDYIALAPNSTYLFDNQTYVITVEVNIKDDDTAEATECFMVTFEKTSGTIARDTVSVCIIDNDGKLGHVIWCHLMVVDFYVCFFPHRNCQFLF